LFYSDGKLQDHNRLCIAEGDDFVEKNLHSVAWPVFKFVRLKTFWIPLVCFIL